jgi:ATP-dependent DNA helicase RecQ
MRLGYVGVDEGEYATLNVTEEGMAVLRARTPITLTKPMDLPKARRVARREGDIACDEILFERLRALRKRLADERGVPAYIIFGDATLRALAHSYPTSVGQLDGIPGIGEKARRIRGGRGAGNRRLPEDEFPAGVRLTGPRGSRTATLA